MKVTAIIEDNAIAEAIKYSKAKTITEALKVALAAYIAQQKLMELGNQIQQNPLKFNKTAEEIRKLNQAL